MSTSRNFFTSEQKMAITDAIKQAELNTSGEIRVHIEDKCKGDVLDRASFIFEKLKMHKTQLRNGVLFYLAVKNKKFAILGDAGINAVVPDDFWNEIKNILTGIVCLGILVLFGCFVMLLIIYYPWALLSILGLGFAWAAGATVRGQRG